MDEAAGKVLALTSLPDGKCVFLSSGSEAVEFSVQVAKKIIKKPYLLCLKQYFLSSYGTSSTRTENEWITFDCSQNYEDIDTCLAEIPFDQIGAFVFEPGNASGTVQLPPKSLIAEIVRRVQASGGLLVVDEVTTGIGRTGKWFGYQHYDIQPDIIAMGKGIGNGYPVSVIALSKKVSAAAEEVGFKYAQSHQNDPLGCAVVKAVISAIEHRQLIRHASAMGEILKDALVSLLYRHSCIKEVRGTGLMLAMEFHQTVSLEQIHKELFAAGYITGFHSSANLLRFYPPLTVEASHIKSMVQTLERLLNKRKTHS